jgi:thioredoxin reductase (NADPH)
MEFFSTPDLLEIGGHPFPTAGYKPVREEAIDYYRGVALSEGLDLALYERVIGLEGRIGTFQVLTEAASHATRFVVLATGFFDIPVLLGIPGEDLPKVTHYYKEPFAYSGQSVLVIGAKNSAAKAALECHRHGADVTMAVREPAISDSVKYWIKPDLENRIREGSIRCHFNTTVRRIEPGAVVLETPSGRKQIVNNWVLAMTGYQPDYDLLETLGVSIERDDVRTPTHDESTFETNRAGLYIAGTVCGGLHTSRWFIENGRLHAQIIADHIEGRVAAL